MNATTEPDADARESRFRALYDATYRDLLRFVSRRVHPSHAEDVVADCFLVAWRRLEELPPDPAAARAWLFGVARRSLLAEHRGAHRREALAVRILDSGRWAAVADDADVVAGRLDLRSGWGRLSPAEQEVIALSAWDGLSSAQAAEVLGITATAYRLRLSRARRALRRHAGVPSTTHATRPTTERSTR